VAGPAGAGCCQPDGADDAPVPAAFGDVLDDEMQDADLDLAVANRFANRGELSSVGEVRPSTLTFLEVMLQSVV
jgi:hypothetical protein